MFAKTFAIVAAASFVAVASGATCTDSSAEIAKLIPITSNPNLGTCTTDSGYNLLSPTGLPTDEQTAKMCASSACTALISAVQALNPSDCDISLGTITINVGSLVNSFATKCAALSTTAPPASTTATPATTTATPVTTTATPASTTATPSTSTDSPAMTTAAPTTSSGTGADNAC